MNYYSYSWSRWRAFDLFERLNGLCRSDWIIQNAETISHYLVDWCDASKLTCRPKEGVAAVMFLVNYHYCWCRLKWKELDAVRKHWVLHT